jgi:hypothetical protein
VGTDKYITARRGRFRDYCTIRKTANRTSALGMDKRTKKLVHVYWTKALHKSQ